MSIEEDDREEEPAHDSTREARALVAEDDPAMRELLVQILRAERCAVVDVASGDEMLHVLTVMNAAAWPHDAFDVIVADHRMPHCTGLDVVARLRRASCTTPVLLVSAFADAPLLTRADELEAMVMAKPFSIEVFRLALGVLLSLRSRGARRPKETEYIQ